MKTIIFAALLTTLAATAEAQTIYNTRALYNVAHPSNTVIDFNGYTPGPTQYGNVTEVTPAGNVIFDAIPTALNVEFLGQSNFPFLGPNNLALYAFNGQFLADSLAITLPANTFSFGLDLISPSSTVPEPYQLSVYSGNTLLTTLSSPSVNNGYTFIGYDSLSNPITTVTLQIANAVGNSQPVIDNFTLAAVPEPATSALTILGGVAIFALFGVRRQSR